MVTSAGGGLPATVPVLTSRPGFEVQPSVPRGEEPFVQGPRPPQREDDVPGQRLQLPRAADGMEMLHLPLLGVSSPPILEICAAFF